MRSLPIQTKKNNKSGVTGVSVNDKNCYSYIVNDSAKRMSKKFSVAKYGRYEALRLAIKWRRDKELEIHGYSVIPASLVRENIKHKQSRRKAEITERSKKRAALEHRENIKRELALRKKGCQKTAGKFIYRIDDLMMGHGWLLRIEMNEEFIYQMSFRDSEYGSPRIGLIEAQRKRDTLLKMHNIPYAEGRRFSKKIRATNSTGVPGVCRSGFHYHCYIPLLPNKRKTRKISIVTYGEKLAFQMAVEWRREMETEVYGGTVLTDKEVEEIFKRK